jgi:hypothetical protein
MTDQLLYEAGGVSLDLMAPPFTAEFESSWGNWAPVTSTAVSAFLDGSVVSGDGTDNRLIQLRVLVKADTRSVLAQACEALVSVANQPAATLTWLSDDGPAQVYETYRAQQLSRLDDEKLGALERRYQLPIPARPWVRSLARQQAVAATAAGVVVDDMESASLGVMMGRQVRIPLTTGLVADWGPTADPNVTPVLALKGTTLQGGQLSATGATVADSGTGSSALVRVTATGTTVLVQSVTASLVSADYVTCIWGARPNAGTVTYQAGVQWLDASSTVVRTDWGSSMVVSAQGGTYAVWQASPRPATATQVRPVLRYAAISGDVSLVLELTVMPSARVTLTPTGIAHDGAASMGIVAEDRLASGGGGGSAYAWMTSGYVHRLLPGPVDVSAQPLWRVWLQYTGPQYARTPRLVQVPTLRLWDGAGHWSRWAMTTVMAPAQTWLQLSGDLTSPVESSTTPCDLTAVVAWDVSIDMDLDDIVDGSTESSMTAWLDTLTAGPAATATTSTRGSVLTLGPILGSARTTAGITVSSPTAMSSLLVACIDGTTGDPLLAITSNKASGAGYAGTYSVLAPLRAPDIPTNPTLTVSQKIAGTVVATQVLTGIQPAGNWWVDFGTVSLPLVATPDENASVTYDFAVAPTTLTTWTDLLIVDVYASMVWLSNLSTARKVVMVDEPPPEVDLGGIWVGDALDRTDGRAPMTPGVPTRPLHVQTPSTRLLVYCPGSGIITLSAMVLYWPRWVAEAMV